MRCAPTEALFPTSIGEGRSCRLLSKLRTAIGSSLSQESALKQVAALSTILTVLLNLNLYSGELRLTTRESDTKTDVHLLSVHEIRTRIIDDNHVALTFKLRDTLKVLLHEITRCDSPLMWQVTYLKLFAPTRAGYSS